MRLTSVLNSPPRFHYWKEFGAGRKRRIPYYKMWWNTWRNIIFRKEMPDHTLQLSQLPPGSRLMDAEDFMKGPIDMMPEDLIKFKEEKILYDHPWPFNVQLDAIKNQERMYCYQISSRFFKPRVDSLVLTNTLLETDQMQANPPIEPTEENIEIIQRQYDWARKGDSVLVRLPKKRTFPKINIKPMATFGVSKERQETNILNSIYDYTQSLMAQHHHSLNNNETLNELLHRRLIAFPKCQVPFSRQEGKLNLELCIDSMSISNSPLPLVEPEPLRTKEKEPITIKPRSWKSVLEQTNNYSPDWTFTLPRNSFPHTIQLAGRIKRDHRDTDEMLARCIVHAFGLTSQFANLQGYENYLMTRSGEEISNKGSIILQDPLKYAAELCDKDLLDRPIVLQTIGFDLFTEHFYFMRYQLNTTKFDDTNESRVKNQAWYSGPISDLSEVLRYYLDFQAFSSQSELSKPRLLNTDWTAAGRKEEAAVGQ